MPIDNNAARDQRRHRSLIRSSGIRTKILRHVAALSVISIYFLISFWLDFGHDDSTNELAVVVYLLVATMLYIVTCYSYPIVRHAWDESKK